MSSSDTKRLACLVYADAKFSQIMQAANYLLVHSKEGNSQWTQRN